MASPADVPLDGSRYSELTTSEMKLLVLGSLCIDGKLDSGKLALLTGTKKNSASTMFTKARAKLQKSVGSDLKPNNESDSSPAKRGAETKMRTPTKRRKSTAKQASPEATPDTSPSVKRGPENTFSVDDVPDSVLEQNHPEIKIEQAESSVESLPKIKIEEPDSSV